MSFAGLLRQSIAISNPNNTPDLHGKDSYASPMTVKCRFERVYKTIVTANRDREPIQGQAVILPSFTPVEGAKVVFGGEAYRVMARSDAPGRNGQVHHYELMLQLWSYGS